jgi:TRAP transporter TAXI family solute receptor
MRLLYKSIWRYRFLGWVINMRYSQPILLLVLLIILSACSRGPDAKLLSIEIQQRLDQQFSENLFKIKKLTRKGSAPRLDGVAGIYIYYNLELEFLRDYNLISRRNLNVGTLAVVLGASTTSIEGFNSAGNHKGDRLLIRGRLGFQQTDGAWAVNTFTPLQAEETTAVVETLDTPSPKAIIKNIRELLNHNIDASRSAQDRITLHELRRSLARIDLGHADLDQYLTFGTGWPSGSYYKFGEAFAVYANKQGFRVFNYASEGSLENGYRLNTGRIDFALLQSDVAEVLYKGWVEEGQLPSPDLRAIASLWPEAIHVITLEKSGLRKFSAIKDKRIAIGSLRSGTRFTAARIWLAAGFERMDSNKVKLLGRGNSIKALENDEVDVIIIAGAIPDPALQDLAQRRDDIRFIPLDQTLISKLTDQNFTYYGKQIPAKTYPGQTEPVLTLGMAALLATNVNTSNEDVAQFMKLMRDGTGEIARTFYGAGFITDETSRLGISMPLHPGAEEFYKEISRSPASSGSALTPP